MDAYNGHDYDCELAVAIYEDELFPEEGGCPGNRQVYPNQFDHIMS